MYKQKLQELCQRKQWGVPKYTWAKDGPDHDPRFRASVAVGGATFDAPPGAAFKSSKEALNEAARVAFDHLTSAAAPLPPPSEMQRPFKSQLLCYAQRRILNQPLYDVVHCGPPHARRFKASVTVDGQTFESPQFFNTLKDAEHAAAQVALMSLPEEGNQEVEPGFHKNLLQELTQKEGLSMPVYKTVKDGPSHMPTFISTVEIEGESFQGIAAKSKKEAEMKAAKVARARLRERKLSRLPASISSSFRMLDIKDDFSNSQSTDSHLTSFLSLPVTCTNPEDDGNIIITDIRIGSKDNSTSEDGNSAACPAKPETEITAKEGQSSSSSDIVDASLLCNRVRVYPRKPNMQFPQGTTLLPFSDDMWVAVTLDSSNHEGAILV